MTSSQLRFSFALIIAVLTVSKCFPSEEKDLLSEWEEFKLVHGRNYEDPEEEEMRFDLFKENREMVLKHNERYQRGEESYETGLNRFSDQTPEEVKSITFGFNGEDALKSLEGIEEYVPSNRGVPNEVDWRQKGAVTSVKNQDPCGACYAFSAVGAIEGLHAIKTGNLISLSVQQIVDCSVPYGNTKCGGGLPHKAFNYIKDAGGIASDNAYPYERRNGTCRFDKSTIVARITGYRQVTQLDENALKEVVGSVGPVSVAINAQPDSFLHYRQGVYSDPSCSRENFSHAVLVVGYGVENGRDYWLIKNSWGSNWGEQGYMKLARNNRNECAIGSYAVYPVL